MTDPVKSLPRGNNFADLLEEGSIVIFAHKRGRMFWDVLWKTLGFEP